MANSTEDLQTAHSVQDALDVLFKILKPEKKFYVACAVYGVAISLFTLAAPISVQTLINTVANTALQGQVILLALILFALLLFSGALYALQKYLMELFERRFFARIVSEIVMQNIYADVSYFRTINRAELVNRYFDIMTVQKNIPYLLTGGFALILQSIVGLMVVSFYHPAFLAFNVFFVISVFLIWRVWGPKAILTALSFSNAKYDVAKWLEEIAHANTDFKAHDRIVYALERSEKLTKKYINTREKHFRHYFRQIVSFLFVYAFFSAALLGLGGVLVVRGELSLGQLVAAELILTAIFYGVSQAGTYFDMLYELIPAAEKIFYFSKVPIEDDEGKVYLPNECFEIVFDNVHSAYRNTTIHFDFKISAGQKILCAVSSHTLQEHFIDLLQSYKAPDKGQILLGGQDITEINPQVFRDKIYVLDEPFLVEATIEEYLKIGAPNATRVEIVDVLKALELNETIEDLPEGLDTRIISSGYPLSNSETIRIKLAAALLAKPSVLILTELFDIIGYNIRQKIVKYLHGIEGMTFLYFTNRRDLDFFDAHLYLDWDEDSFHKDLEDLRENFKPV